MEAKITWVPITDDLYKSILNHFHSDFSAFGVVTDMDEQWYGKPYVITEWGFKDADVPMVKYVRKGDVESFFIASTNIVED